MVPLPFCNKEIEVLSGPPSGDEEFQVHSRSRAGQRDAEAHEGRCRRVANVLPDEPGGGSQRQRLIVYLRTPVLVFPVLAIRAFLNLHRQLRVSAARVVGDSDDEQRLGAPQEPGEALIRIEEGWARPADELIEDLLMEAALGQASARRPDANACGGPRARTLRSSSTDLLNVRRDEEMTGNQLEDMISSADSRHS